MHKKNQEERYEDAPAARNSAQEKLFRANTQENGSVAENLAQDQQFRKFFTTSVIEVPEEMRKVDRDLTDGGEPEEKKRRGIGGWLKNKFAVSDDSGEVDVRVPHQAQGQAQETEESFEERLEPIDDDIKESAPHPQKESAFAPKTETSADFRPEKHTVQQEGATAQPRSEQLDNAQSAAPQKPETTGRSAALRSAQKAKHVDVGSLLEQIDEAQASMTAEPGESAPQKPTAAVAKRVPAQPETAATPAGRGDMATQPGPVVMLEPTSAELADRTPKSPENKKEGAPHTADTPDEKAAALPPETKPAQTEAAAPKKAPTGRIVFSDEAEQAPEEQALPAAEQEPAQPGEAATEQQTDSTRIYHPQKVADAGQATGEVSLTQESAEPDAFADTEKTGEVPLFDAEESAGEQQDAEYGRGQDKPETALHVPHGWKKLSRLFAGEEEPDEESEQTVPSVGEDTGELEYCNPEDADAIRNELESRKAALTLRCTLTGILAAALIVLDLMGQSVLPSPAIIDPVAAPAAWLGVHLILLGICIALALPVMKNGLLSLLPHKPASADALAALATLAAALQTAFGLLKSSTFDPAQITMFSGAAALLLFADLLGQRLGMDAVHEGFTVMTSGVENATGYCLTDARLLHTLCDGMDEKDPVLLLSRPGSLLKNFMAQSFAPHRSDRLAVEFARTLGIAGVIGFAVTLAKGKGVTMGFSVLAAILCMGAPLSAALIRAIPSRLMQRAAAQVGAVIPGWPAIEQLGEVDMVQADAAELFPPMCAHLYGIKTFRKERIDLAILYATSILIESCNTLSGLFRNMIENHTDMLYPVKDLEKRAGRGYLAWCDNCRVVLGTRELMGKEGIALPAMDYENRYTQNGDRHVLYLAVSGQLYAMFLYGYSGTKKVAHTLSILRRENIRLLVKADDPTLTAARIEEAYRLRPGFVKVLNGPETEAMAPATAYLPATDGCLVHLGGFASLIGGLQAAAGADSAEHNACTIQTVSVTVSVILGLLLSFAGSLAHISLAAVLLYQIAWSALGIAITLTKKY